jgi:hypothetical protein
MGDFVYAISANGITATNLSTMENSASIPLDYQNPYEDYYYVHSEEVVESENTTEKEPSGEGSAPTTD